MFGILVASVDICIKTTEAECNTYVSHVVSTVEEAFAISGKNVPNCFEIRTGEEYIDFDLSLNPGSDILLSGDDSSFVNMTHAETFTHDLNVQFLTLNLETNITGNDICMLNTTINGTNTLELHAKTALICYSVFNRISKIVADTTVVDKGIPKDSREVVGLLTIEFGDSVTFTNTVLTIGILAKITVDRPVNATCWRSVNIGSEEVTTPHTIHFKNGMMNCGNAFHGHLIMYQGAIFFFSHRIGTLTYYGGVLYQIGNSIVVDINIYRDLVVQSLYATRIHIYNASLSVPIDLVCLEIEFVNCHGPVISALIFKSRDPVFIIKNSFVNMIRISLNKFEHINIELVWSFENQPMLEVGAITGTINLTERYHLGDIGHEAVRYKGQTEV